MVNFRRKKGSVSEIILDFMNFFHTFQHKDMPEIEVIEHKIPKWVTSDWKLYKETLTHIMLLSIKTAGKFGKIIITLSFVQFNKKKRNKGDERLLADEEVHDDVSESPVPKDY